MVSVQLLHSYKLEAMFVEHFVLPYSEPYYKHSGIFWIFFLNSCFEAGTKDVRFAVKLFISSHFLMLCMETNPFCHADENQTAYSSGNVSYKSLSFLCLLQAWVSCGLTALFSSEKLYDFLLTLRTFVEAQITSKY